MPLLRNRYVHGWPGAAVEDAGAVHYAPLGDVLSRRWHTDAHFACYSVPSVPRRLNSTYVGQRSAFGLPPVHVVAFVADVDGPGHVATAQWLDRQRPKLLALAADHPGVAAWAGPGGYKIAALLAEPLEIETEQDALDYRRWYVAHLNYLERAYGIKPDRACASWNWLFRAPYVRRDGVDQGHPVLIGDLAAVGTWEPRLNRVDWPRAEKPKVKPAGAPVAGRAPLAKLFDARGWLGREIAPGKWAAICPWADAHTSGRPFDSSTVIYAPSSDQPIGHMHCAHAHCVGRRSLADVLAIFSVEERAAAGLVVSKPGSIDSIEGAR